MRRRNLTLQDKEHLSGKREALERLLVRGDKLMTESLLFLNHDITEEIFASELGISRTWLSMSISLRNISFREYLAEYRIRHAVENMHHGRSLGRRKKILDYAYESGFSSERQFNKYLKLFTGRTASQFLR